MEVNNVMNEQIIGVERTNSPLETYIQKLYCFIPNHGNIDNSLQLLAMER